MSECACAVCRAHKGPVKRRRQLLYHAASKFTTVRDPGGWRLGWATAFGPCYTWGTSTSVSCGRCALSVPSFEVCIFCTSPILPELQLRHPAILTVKLQTRAASPIYCPLPKGYCVNGRKTAAAQPVTENDDPTLQPSKA